MLSQFKSWLSAWGNWVRSLISSFERRRIGRRGVDLGDVLVLILIIICFLGFIALFFSMLAFALLWPLALAWAINTLFGTAIPLTFTTWLAIFVIFWAWKFFTSAKVTINHTRR